MEENRNDFTSGQGSAKRSEFSEKPALIGVVLRSFTSLALAFRMNLRVEVSGFGIMLKRAGRELAGGRAGGQVSGRPQEEDSQARLRQQAEARRWQHTQGRSGAHRAGSPARFAPGASENVAFVWHHLGLVRRGPGRSDSSRGKNFTDGRSVTNGPALPDIATCE